MEPIRTLIVEDDTLLQTLLRNAIGGLVDQVEIAGTVEAALTELQRQKYDLLVVDRTLPDGDGLDLVMELNEAEQPTRSLIISALRTSLPERLSVYRAGGHDFLSKPFHMSEFKAKFNNLLALQRCQKTSLLRFADIGLNTETGQLYLGTQPARVLRRKEVAILACLLRNRPAVISKNQIIQSVWGLAEESPTYSTLDVYIRRLRTHLRDHHALIKTARGYGYYFAES